jgi:hypothetical protein
MGDYITAFKDWLIALGERHSVDPLLLGCLYLVSKVGLVSFLAWAVKNLRAKKPIIAPLSFAGACFSLPYLYLVIAGENISVWVYVFIGSMFMYGGFMIYRKIAAAGQ